MERREAYQQKIEAQFREWDAKLDVLEATADKAKAEARIEYQKKIEELKAKKEELSATLRELSRGGETAFENLKGKLDDGVEAIQRGLDKVREKLH